MSSEKTQTLLDQISHNGQQFLQNDSQDNSARQAIIRAAQSLIQQLEDPGEWLTRVGWGEPSRTAALRVFFDLGLYAKMSPSKPVSSTELAKDLPEHGDPVLIARVMKHLAANGIVNESGVDEYTATPFVMSMNDPSMSAGLVYSFEGMIPSFHGLPGFLAETAYKVPSDMAHGPVQYGLKTEKSFFEYLQAEPKLGSAFNNFMTAYAQNRPKWVDFYPCQERLIDGANKDANLVLVDVGGGLGGDITNFYNKFPEMQGKLVLQDTVDTVQQVTTAGTLPKGIKVVAHDFFTPQENDSKGARAYFLRLVLHDWPDHKCKDILSHLRDAMVVGYSKLLINENVLPDRDAAWQQTALDWTMMAMLVSQERTERQWRAMLDAAGFRIEKIWSPPGGGECVIEAVPVDS